MADEWAVNTPSGQMRLADFTLDQLIELLDREPFQSFRIITTSGDRYDVTNPHLVALCESQLVYCYPRSNKLAYIRLNQLVAFETLEQAA